MITDDHARRIALFFLFSLMDEKAALHAAHDVIAHLKASRPGDGVSHSPVEVIRACRKFWPHYRKNLPKNRPATMPASVWTLPSGVDLAQWAKFQKDSSDEEVIALVLSKILGYSDEEISEAFGVTIGTVRFRVGKAVRQLGQTIKSAAGAKAAHATAVT